MQSNKIRVAITQGDPNGIGYEIILKTLIDSRVSELCIPIIYGNRGAAEYYKKNIAGLESIQFNLIDSPEKAQPKRINLISIGDNFVPRPGEVNPVAGSLAIAALKTAVRDAKNGTVDVLVTCPIDKKNTTGDDFGFIGHTEFLAREFSDAQPLMFMISQTLRVGLVTMHIPLDRVASEVTTEKILEHIRLMRRSLERDFTIRAPKIAVLGLNPHSGDNGLIGNQEQEIIIPAIKSAQFEDTLAYGPFAADGYFGSGNFEKFDATLAMYHDQGLAPFKALVFDDGVNFTAGLSVVRTSPAHGVGFDIAGKGVANEAPFRSALYAALDIFNSRAFNEEISANPMKHYVQEQGGRNNRDANVEDILPSHPESL